MAQDGFETQVKRLITGLADQEIKSGNEFRYGGGVVHADDVATIGLPSILCIAQDLSSRVGMGNFGYSFKLGEANPVFPLHATQEREGVKFFEVAPFLTEVFDGEVMDCRHDLALLFEAAAKVVRSDYNLQSDTDHKTSLPTEKSARPAISPTLER